MHNPFVLGASQLTLLHRIGMEPVTDSVNDAKTFLVRKLKAELFDISDIYNIGELLEMHEAVFGEAEIIRVSERQVTLEDVQRQPQHSNTTRKKVRIDLTQDISFATPLLEHLVKFDSLSVAEIKTGLAVKYSHGGYRSNVLNYNELRTVHGELHGNLYFNLIKSEDQFNQLGINKDFTWFRSFAMVPKINVYDVIDCLTNDNVDYLVSLNKRANKRKLASTEKLLETVA